MRGDGVPDEILHAAERLGESSIIVTEYLAGCYIAPVPWDEAAGSAT